jgi:long-chain acyl-CoA synthetase
VGLFASLAAGPVVEIARRVTPQVAFVSGPAQWAKLGPIAAELRRGGLRAVLSLAPLPEESLPAGLTSASRAALDAGASAVSVPELEQRAAAVRTSDPYLLLFTSGTTGRHKGVRLSQGAMTTAVDFGAATTRTTEHDLGLHLLPFGHIAGHDQFCLALAQGHALAMVSRREDLPRALALGPTYVLSVPLVLERIRNQALRAVEAQPAPLRTLLLSGVEAAARVRVDGSRALGDRLLAGLADRLVGARLRRGLGGRMGALFSGGAPASASLRRFFDGFGVPFIEIYGMSETAGLIAMNLRAGPRKPGSVGLITPDHEARIAADGELEVRGPLLMDGYLDPEDEEGAFTPDGFFRTGDLGRIDDDGHLTITGRKKHLMVLSTGKKVAPEPIESALSATSPFQGAVLLGEGRPYVSAAVFVAADDLARFDTRGQDPARALLPHAHAALDGFSDFERPKKLLVIPGAPSDHPALITPSFKVKREALLDFLGPRVAELYQ